jgi:hypothetical protein
LVRASRLHREGRGFESHSLYIFIVEKKHKAEIKNCNGGSKDFAEKNFVYIRQVIRQFIILNNFC